MVQSFSMDRRFELIPNPPIDHHDGFLTNQRYKYSINLVLLTMSLIFFYHKPLKIKESEAISPFGLSSYP